MSFTVGWIEDRIDCSMDHGIAEKLEFPESVPCVSVYISCAHDYMYVRE